MTQVDFTRSDWFDWSDWFDLIWFELIWFDLIWSMWFLQGPNYVMDVVIDDTTSGGLDAPIDDTATGDLGNGVEEVSMMHSEISPIKVTCNLTRYLIRFDLSRLIWSDLIWFDLIWSDLIWTDWPDWFDFIRLIGLDLIDSIWYDWIRSDLMQFDCTSISQIIDFVGAPHRTLDGRSRQRRGLFGVGRNQRGADRGFSIFYRI